MWGGSEGRYVVTFDQSAYRSTQQLFILQSALRSQRGSSSAVPTVHNAVRLYCCVVPPSVQHSCRQVPRYSLFYSKLNYIYSRCRNQGFKFIFYIYPSLLCGRGSSVSITNDYGLDGPGIESRWGEIFRPSRPVLGSTQPPVQWVPGLPRG